MDIKEIAEESGAVAYSPAPLRAVRGYSFTFEQLQHFAEALIAEIAKGNEPVAWYDGNKFYANETSAFCGCADLENLRPVFTFPPTASQIEQETAEAIAKYLRVIGVIGYEGTAFKGIVSGAWKEFKKS